MITLFQDSDGTVHEPDLVRAKAVEAILQEAWDAILDTKDGMEISVDS